MDYGAMLTDSFEYAKDALLGKWVRWILFIIFGLPFALVKFTFDPETIVDKATGAFHPEVIPWGTLALLIGIGILFGFFLSGYMVRVYRGAKPAPDFDQWPQLFVDGLKLTIVWVLWFLPFLIVLGGACALIISAVLSGDKSALIATIGLLLVMMLVGFVLAIIAILYSYLGSVRFARTGSIREGIRFREITAMIRKMGWGTYIIALVVMLIAGFAFGIVTMILSLIPYIGWALVVIVTPFATILFGRYATLVYEQGETRPGADLSVSGNNP